MTITQQNPQLPSLQEVFQLLLDHFGPQGWWPAVSPFEMVVGAILTQNTAWVNVEKAIHRLKEATALSVESLDRLSVEDLAVLIHTAGFHTVKAHRLKAFTRFLITEHNASLSRLYAEPLDQLRTQLLTVSGIGPETADCIILYGAHKPIFVIDAYTRRMFKRHGYSREPVDYASLQQYVHTALKPDTNCYQEFHALLVMLGKTFCKTQPQCEHCPLRHLARVKRC